jgi:REP element-mobilizing transposase RayT
MPMTKFKDKYRIESTRLPGWDYSAPGWYFVTICTDQRLLFFGEIVDGQMRLSQAGQIVAEEWLRTPQVRSNVVLDEWVIMPNHIHGIIVILPRESVAVRASQGDAAVETSRRDVSTTVPFTPPRQDEPAQPMAGLRPHTLGAIVSQIKSVCTKRIWASGMTDFAWQPRFYDHVIRDEASLARIRQYIRNNPIRWALDRDGPVNLYM